MIKGVTRIGTLRELVKTFALVIESCCMMPDEQEFHITISADDCKTAEKVKVDIIFTPLDQWEVPNDASQA
jgi:hypothetical protein